ncbi:MAG: hypothetical protein WKF58_13005 [Ilumatobacteraceae bacterium]
MTAAARCRHGGIGDLAERRHDGIGYCRLRARVVAVPRPRHTRRLRHEVARCVRVGGQPGAAAAPDDVGHAQRRRSAGTRHRGVDGRRACRSWSAPASRVVASIWGRSVDEYRAAADLLAAAPAVRRRRRGEPVVPQPGGAFGDVRPRRRARRRGDRGDRRHAVVHAGRS